MKQQMLEQEIIQKNAEIERLKDQIERLQEVGKYNGWGNYETWLVNVWCGDYWAEQVEDGEHVDQNTMKEMVEEMLSLGGSEQAGLLSDAIGAFVSAVRWHELYSHLDIQEDEEGEAA